MRHRLDIILALSVIVAGPASAAVVGRIVPSAPLTLVQIASLPAANQPAWRAYLTRSEAAHRADLAALQAEQRDSAAAPPLTPEGKQGTSAASMPLGREAAWYASPDARHVADVIVSFQTPAGGWGKNEPRTGAVRVRGQPFTPDKSFVGTLDNDATVTELRFLARVIGQIPSADSRAYRQSFARGLGYLLASQYPNGGWPQVWPLEGGYHDAVTYNDGAMLAAARLLALVAEGKGDFAFATPDQRRDAQQGWNRALDCILASQIVIGGQPAGWSQQHDATTLAPVGARNFEPASLATAESAEILVYLMSLPMPSPKVARAIRGGATWLAGASIRDKSWTEADPTTGRRLVGAPGAGPLWSRYYDLATGKPIFGDRDLTIHDDVNEISLERRNGYAWFNRSGEGVALAYESWIARQAAAPVNPSLGVSN
jgi:PelA/Pel-15E family pectate lyase